MKSVYIHIPFCKHICSYCDFCKMNYNKEEVHNYLKALAAEIDEFYMDELMETVYIGGGTPSCLAIEELKELFNILKKIKISCKCEYTFECNPSDINDDLLDLLINNGVNRLSIGVESFNKENLKLLEREIDFDDLKQRISLIRYKGINNINLDLMYALPNETFETLKKDVKKLIKLNPEHISTYSLIIENNTKLKINRYENINDELDLKMYNYIRKKMAKKGYKQYEISNFCQEGYESKHNQTYWLNEEYYGFGLGASGYINGFRYENTKSLTDYKNGNYHLTESLLSKQEIMEYELMLGLRLLKGINLSDFYDKYGINLQEVFPIKPLLQTKDLIYKNGHIFINPEKLYVMNEILLKLI